MARVWQVKPVDQGQIVEIAWLALGEDGAIRRVTDRSDQSVSYSLHAWDDSGLEYEPWNGQVPCEVGGDDLTSEQAETYLRDGD